MVASPSCSKDVASGSSSGAAAPARRVLHLTFPLAASLGGSLKLDSSDISVSMTARSMAAVSAESTSGRLFQMIQLPLTVEARTLLPWPPQPLSPRRASAPSVEMPPLSACAARLNSRPMTAGMSAAPTSTGGAPTAQVTGSNRHPGAAARGGAE